MKFTIDRKIWLRGEGEENSYLHRTSDGKQCCVGIYLSACGVPVAELEDRADAYGLALPNAARWLRGSNYTAGDLYHRNDEKGISEQRRETRICELFAKNGVEVEFVG